MNPMMLVQAAGAVAGLIGGFIPDKTKTVEHVNNTEGSDLAGRVPGAIGAQSTESYTDEKYQTGLKKGLLTASKVAGAVGSVGGALGAAGLKMPKMGGGAIGSTAQGMSDLSSTLSNANASFKASMTPAEDINTSELPSDLGLKFNAFNSPEAMGALPSDGVIIPPVGRLKGI